MAQVLSPSDLGLWIVLRSLCIGLTFLLDFCQHRLLRRCVRDMATLDTLGISHGIFRANHPANITAYVRPVHAARTNTGLRTLHRGNHEMPVMRERHRPLPQRLDPAWLAAHQVRVVLAPPIVSDVGEIPCAPLGCNP